jgi:hypothetical protein
MISKLDVWPAGNLLIRQHDENVELEAARFQDLMLARADDEGRVVWQRGIQEGLVLGSR